MKKTILFLWLIYWSDQILAQNNFPSTGDVTIGTTVAKARLSIVGTVLTGGSYANLDPYFASNNLNWLVNSSQMLIGWNRSGIDGESDFISNRGAGYVGGFSFYDYGNDNTIKNLVRIMGNGNVGIGITSPTEKLSVNGSIRSKEVKVESANWPDYVFAKQYELPTLKETENYIRKNGHLSDMPTADEISLKGVELGDLSAKLLKKIEELTLHLIILEKANEKQ